MCVSIDIYRQKIGCFINPGQSKIRISRYKQNNGLSFLTVTTLVLTFILLNFGQPLENRNNYL